MKTNKQINATELKLCKVSYSNTAGYGGGCSLKPNMGKNWRDGWTAEGFSTRNPFPKYRSSGSEHTTHSPSKQQQQKMAKRHKFPQTLWCNCRSILPLFSFYQEPIHRNNSWKYKLAYYPLHHQVIGVFVFCLRLLLQDWIILLFCPPEIRN